MVFGRIYGNDNRDWIEYEMAEIKTSDAIEKTSWGFLNFLYSFFITTIWTMRQRTYIAIPNHKNYFIFQLTKIHQT